MGHNPLISVTVCQKRAEFKFVNFSSFSMSFYLPTKDFVGGYRIFLPFWGTYDISIY